MSKVMCQVEKSTLDLAVQAFTLIRGIEDDDPKQKNSRGKQTPGKKGGKSGTEKVDPTDLNSVLNTMLSLIVSLVEQQKEVSASFTELKDMLNQQSEERRKEKEVHREEMSIMGKQLRVQKDETDEIKQRGLKGNLILSSPAGEDKMSLVKNMEQLSRDKTSLTDHVLNLIKLKYEVNLPKSDIQACHFLPKNNILLKIWNRAPGSAWEKLTEQIKQGGKKNINFYANFQMTTQRNNILYHLRSLRKEGKILKLYSNENGQLFFKKSEQSRKVKVTYTSIKKGDNPVSFSIQEINDLIVKM